MRFSAVKALALTLFVTGSQVLAPNLGGAVPSVSAAPFISGSSRFVVVAPARLADTRPDQGAFGYTAISSNVVRVQVAGREGVPANATAAVLNVTGVNTTAPGFVTVYPAGTDTPDRLQRQLRRSRPGAGQHGHRQARRRRRRRRVHAATDGRRGRRVGCICSRQRGCRRRPPGRPVPTVRSACSTPGTVRRDGVAGNSTERRRCRALREFPPTRSAVVVNVTATADRRRLLDCVSVGPRPSERQQPQHRPRRRDTRRPGHRACCRASPAFNVYSQGGGHLIVDVTGWFTGSNSASHDRRTFPPVQPHQAARLSTTRPSCRRGAAAPSNSPSTAPGQVAAVAINVTGTDR